MSDLNKTELEGFVKRIEGFKNANHPQKIINFGYYVTKIAEQPYFDHKSIRKCYELLDQNPPANISDFLIKLRENDKLVIANSGYRVARSESDKIDLVMENPSLTSVSNELKKLYEKLGKIDNDFLKEALDCFKVKAWHAVIVLVWIITMDHLQDYVINRNLIEFNKTLKQNGNYKNITINTKADFEEIKDADFIVVLRTLGWITGGQMKILEGKLDIRNSYAHPSTLILTENMTMSFVEDLMLNVVSQIH